MIYEPPRKTSDFTYMASHMCTHTYHHTSICKTGKERNGGHRDNREHWTNIRERKRSMCEQIGLNKRRQVSFQLEEKTEVWIQVQANLQHMGIALKVIM